MKASKSRTKTILFYTSRQNIVLAMPRGYIKHDKEVGKKKARGGSSRRGRVTKKDQDPPRTLCDVEDFKLDAPSATKDNTAREDAVTYPIGECAICFNEGPVVCLSNNCRWHATACHQCLHRVYVTKAQQSTKRYPLTCFHPLCDQRVQAAQMEKHNLFASPAEAKKHHDMVVLSRIQKTDGMRTVHCPECDTPKGIRKLGDKERTFGCKNCNYVYLVSPFYATIRALENMKSDDFGINDGWAKCPHCGIMISKGDGCEHMFCSYCNHGFCWDEAQEKKKKAIIHARVPVKEIYLWW